MSKFITSIYISLLFCWTGLQAQVTISALSDSPLGCNSSTAQVDVVVENFSNIASMQFAMSWDASVLDFQNVTNNLPLTDFFVPNTSQVNSGIYSFSWASFDLNGLSLSDGDTLFTFTFDVVGNAGSSFDFEFIDLSGFSIEVTSALSGPLNIGTDVIFAPTTISIEDNIAPNLACPADTVIFTGTGAVGGLTPTAFDNCGLNNVSYTLMDATTGSGSNDASGTVFNEGITTVTYTATDDAGNMTNCNFTVEVQDTSTTDSGLLTFTPVINYDCTSDTITIDIIVTNFDSVTSMQFTIQWDTAVIDYISNTSFLPSFPPNPTFTDEGLLVIVWATPPTTPEGITVPDGDPIYTIQYVLDSGIQTPLVDFVSLPTLQIEIAQMGSILTSDQYVFADNVLNVNDTNPPTQTNSCPNDLTVNTDPGACEATVGWIIPTFTDDCGIDTVIATAMPGTFPVGPTPVSYTAIDIAGNSTVCEFLITVVDTELPVINVCPGDLSVSTDAGTCTASPALGTLDATDNCGIASITNDAPTNFSVGPTTVTWTVTDDNGNVATCTQTVTVTDNEAPVITNCPGDISVNTDPGSCDATVSLGTPTATDNCGVTSTTNDAPTQFPLGTTTVTWTVSDAQGNSATCTQTVTVTDNEIPTINCPGLDAFDAEDGQCSILVTNNLAPLTSDNCGVASVTYTITGATTGSGNNDATNTVFNVGFSTLTYTVIDDNGNTNTCSVMVQVNDNQVPELTCPNDTVIFVPASVTDTMIFNLTPTATDNCEIASLTYTLSGGLGSGNNDASGTSFPQGTTTVTYTVTDTVGNTQDCSFDVTINPVTTQLIGCPADQTVDNDLGVCGAVVNGIAPVLLIPTANIDTLYYTLSAPTSGNGENDASGTLFNLGTTTVEYFIEDIFGNTDNCSFTVTVNDTEAPTWSNCPLNLSVEVNTDDCRAEVSWAIPIPADNCGIFQVIPSHAPGDTFPLGTTTVTYVAFDAANNFGTCSFDITVTDNTPPTLDCPSDITAYLGAGECETSVTWTPASATDNCTGTTVTCTADPGDTFSIGTTSVECTATDAAGNSVSCTFNVTVLDTLAPIPLNCPDDITVPAGTDCQSVVSWNPPTFSDCPPVSVSSTHSPGEIFPLGSTTVVYIAVDPAGNDTTCSFVVTVEDNVSPIVNCPNDINVPSLTTDCGALVTWPTPTVSDDCDNNVDLSSNIAPGSFFPVGTTEVSYTATDDFGNSATCTFEVTVQDQFAPVFDCPVNANIDADGTINFDEGGLIVSVSPNNSCDSVAVEYNLPTATDNCGISSVDLTAGPASGGSFPIGTTTVTYTAFDINGNFNVCSFDITVEPLGIASVFVSPNDTVCAGETVQFTTDISATGAEFDWEQVNGDWTSSQSAPFRADITEADAGLYSVTVTFASGCTTTGTTELWVDPAPEVSATSNSPLCDGENIELFAEVGAGANVSTYSWTGPDDYTSDEENPVIENPTAANTGIYTVDILFDNGCEASASVAVTVVNLPDPQIDLDCSQDICLGTSCVLNGTEYVPAPEFYNWEAIPASGAGLPANTEDNQITITPTEAGTYIFNYSVEVDECISSEASIVLTVHDAPLAVADTFDVDYEQSFSGSVVDNDTFTTNIGIIASIISGPANGDLVMNEDGTFEYIPNNGFVGLDQFIYQICYDCGAVLCDNAVVNLNVTDDSDCIIPTVITPNQDDINDALVINCLISGAYPNNEITIYNQWGDEVFTAAPYQNNWEGTFDGKDLPDGTYFFVFKLDSNADVQKGYITIFR